MQAILIYPTDSPTANILWLWSSLASGPCGQGRFPDSCHDPLTPAAHQPTSRATCSFKWAGTVLVPETEAHISVMGQLGHSIIENECCRYDNRRYDNR